MHLIQGLEPSPPQCIRKFVVFLGSQFAPGTVSQATYPGADIVRDAALALPYVFQYATNTECAK